MLNYGFVFIVFVVGEVGNIFLYSDNGRFCYGYEKEIGRY